MSWNYRIVKQQKDNSTWYTIHEVYYHDVTGAPKAFGPLPVEAYGETVEELKQCLQNMLKALDKPAFEVPTNWM